MPRGVGWVGREPTAGAVIGAVVGPVVGVTDDICGVPEKKLGAGAGGVIVGGVIIEAGGIEGTPGTSGGIIPGGGGIPGVGMIPGGGGAAAVGGTILAIWKPSIPFFFMKYATKTIPTPTARIVRSFVFILYQYRTIKLKDVVAKSISTNAHSKI
jgi:hypothetical protein